MKKAGAAFGVVVAFIVFWLFIFPGGNTRARAEREHGIKLPASASHIQCRGDAWISCSPDRSAATMFEMNTNDLATFIARLQISSRTSPARPKGDPTEDGYNVWPTGLNVTPGNLGGRFSRTWKGLAKPMELLNCRSSTGDWLAVELWNLENGGLLVKMYTDWN